MSNPTEQQDALADLAYLRRLVEGGDSPNRALGEGYVAGGLIYGAQMLLHAMQGFGWLPSTPLVSWTVGLGPTVVFIPVIVWLSLRNATAAYGATPRAVGAVFGVVGLANLALIAVIGICAWRERSLEIWLIYPCAVFILQGAAWCVAYALRRRPWLGVVGIGWFIWSVVMAAAIPHGAAFVAACGGALLTCMLIPGLIMVRTPSQSP